MKPDIQDEHTNPPSYCTHAQGAAPEVQLKQEQLAQKPSGDAEMDSSKLFARNTTHLFKLQAADVGDLSHVVLRLVGAFFTRADIGDMGFLLSVFEHWQLSYVEFGHQLVDRLSVLRLSLCVIQCPTPACTLLLLYQQAAPGGQKELHSGWYVACVRVLHAGTGMLSMFYCYDWLTKVRFTCV